MGGDVLDEAVISLTEAAGLMPWPTSPVSVARWTRRPVRGVKLESAYSGGRKVTSRQAVERFLTRLNATPAQAAV
jgi:hypothetical protein